MHALLQPLDSVKEILRLTAFLAFVILGMSIGVASADGRKRAILRLIAYVVAITGIVGFTQIESWPFTNWALVHTLGRGNLNRWDLIGLDSHGRKYEIDPRVIEPIGMEEFDSWMRKEFVRSDSDARRSVAEWIVARAEEARQRFLKTGDIGTDGWLLGPLAAPHHFTRGIVWKTPRDVPPDRFTSLQIWLSEWDVDARSRDERQVRRRLIYASP